MERKKFATTGHEYLIEQTQYNGEESVEKPIKRLLLDFSHPTKELIWAMRNGLYTTGRHFLCYSNEDDWTDEIITCSGKILQDSMLLLKSSDSYLDDSTYLTSFTSDSGEKPSSEGSWEEFVPNGEPLSSSNGNLVVTNFSKNKSLWINVDSLMINNYSITNKIVATITVTQDNLIIIEEIIRGVRERDISFPIEYMTDTRVVQSTGVCVYQFSNYGLFITGRGNPLAHALLEYNGQNRVEKRNGRFFGDLQPYMHHSNTPKDGINLYSFAIEPEKLQPTGTSNLSKIENIILTLWFDDPSNPDLCLPLFPMFNLDSRLFVFAFSYNVLRVNSGLVALAYNS